ncbi:hypothetical protein [Humibacter sp.]|uniref:hypothetical protein n=1 Tax=Humibacter sp. TaxID=1940291 RepID=UPI003F8175ED
MAETPNGLRDKATDLSWMLPTGHPISPADSNPSADPYAALRALASWPDANTSHYRWWYQSDTAELRALLAERDALVAEKPAAEGSHD